MFEGSDYREFSDGANVDVNAECLRGVGGRLTSDHEETIYDACSIRFIREIRNDGLGRAAYLRYLFFEANFVSDAARLLGAAVVSAPDEQSLVAHGKALYDLVHNQRRYFSSAFEELGQPLKPSAAAVRKAGHLREIALRLHDKSNYLLIMVFCFATEYFYLRWCSEISSHTDLSGHVGRWVGMHTTSSFQSRVEFLCNELDRQDVGGVEYDEMSELFGATISAEISFHDAVYF